MLSSPSDVLQSLAAVQAELRKLPMAPPRSDLASMAAAAKGSAMSLLRAALKPVAPVSVLGARLMHWNPALADFRVEVVFEGRPASFKVYDSHLDRRAGGRPHVFFDKLYKTKYAAPTDKSSHHAPRDEPSQRHAERDSSIERQFGITYSGMLAKSEIKPHLETLKGCATKAGALVAAVRERLVAVLPAATLAAKQDLHRWIFTVFDFAWQAPSDSPLAAMRYIPIEGLNESMGTDESIVYDLDRLRATPWAEMERRWDKNRRMYLAHLQKPYESWSVELPQYFASRIDDFVRASDWAIDRLVKQLASD